MKRTLRILLCPLCKSDDITLYMGFQFGKYVCKHCDYIGSLILEKKEVIKCKKKQSKKK